MDAERQPYEEFIAAKIPLVQPCGFDMAAVNPMLFPFQSDIVRWALRRGRAAIFADCGMGKTPMQLEWAHRVADHTDRPVLILAPLAVSTQTQREGEKFGIPSRVVRDQSQVRDGINITNYEMLHHFQPEAFSGVVLDESSILKDYTSATRNEVISAFINTPYRLACTATPAPNDFMELGNHSEFLGAMPRHEMLAHFFTHDGGDTAKWRLKRHAQKDFWTWICSWAVMLQRPSDLGYEDDGFTLPPISYHSHVIHADLPTPGYLFALEADSLMDRRRARRDSIAARVAKIIELANSNDEPWVIWCDLNAESQAAVAGINGAVEVCGSDSREDKEDRMLGFAEGKYRVLVSKPSIAGHGMNWQHCRNVAFLGLSDSYEAYYQALRRCWRFGQTQQVNVHIVTAEEEGAVVENIKRKENDAMTMAQNMVANMHDLSAEALHGTQRLSQVYETEVRRGEGWEMRLGDCVEESRHIPDESVGFTIFSPPFASLYTYSASSRDMGNCSNYDDFERHFRFLIPELYRVTMPGRCLSFHCMNLPISKEREGFIGIRDFRGLLIKMFQEEGWIFHSEVCIWKDPVTSMQRTKAIGLLWKQLKKDSCISRQGIPDYIVTMRKPGVNPEPVGHKPEDFPVAQWQQWASPVWMDINPSKTLQRTSARQAEDERHICPLQLEVIERCVTLWSNKGDMVLSPFGGIGSEGYVSLLLGRRFTGIELKRSYWEQACANLEAAAKGSIQDTLWGGIDADEDA